MYVTCIDFNDKNLKRIEIDDVVVVGGWWGWWWWGGERIKVVRNRGYPRAAADD